MNIYEQAILSKRLRTSNEPEWCEFFRLWAAFNCLYSSEVNGNERDRIIRFMQKQIDNQSARCLIDRISTEASKIISTPPGNMRKDASDPQFRTETVRCANAYHDPEKSSNERLANLIGVIYQVRCNLFHGDKNPINARDIDLVRNSNTILQTILPILEDKIAKGSRSDNLFQLT